MTTATMERRPINILPLNALAYLEKSGAVIY